MGTRAKPLPDYRPPTFAAPRFPDNPAEALQTDPASLLARHPDDPEGEVWEKLANPEKPRVIATLRALKDTGS